MGKTLFEKIWNAHAVKNLPDGSTMIYIDRHLIHEVTSPQAFEGLRLSGRKIRRPDLTFATMDHNVPTTEDRLNIKDPVSRAQVEALENNAGSFDLPLFGLGHRWQGIVHVIGPELGLTLPGLTMVCGDSHTSTHGAFGALAFGIGTSEVEHVLVTQTLVQTRPKTFKVEFTGRPGAHIFSKDFILKLLPIFTFLYNFFKACSTQKVQTNGQLRSIVTGNILFSLPCIGLIKSSSSKISKFSCGNAFRSTSFLSLFLQIVPSSFFTQRFSMELMGSPVFNF